jgi:hypothetical protein
MALYKHKKTGEVILKVMESNKSIDIVGTNISKPKLLVMERDMSEYEEYDQDITFKIDNNNNDNVRMSLFTLRDDSEQFLFMGDKRTQTSVYLYNRDVSGKFKATISYEFKYVSEYFKEELSEFTIQPN